jgi:hypothetical protein
MINHDSAMVLVSCFIEELQAIGEIRKRDRPIFTMGNDHPLSMFPLDIFQPGIPLFFTPWNTRSNCAE